MRALFLLKCPLLHVFLHNVILSTMFVLTPYFSILYKYRLEASGSLEGKASQDSLCPHIFEGIVYISLVSFTKTCIRLIVYFLSM